LSISKATKPTGNKRKTGKEQYYTKKDVAFECLKHLSFTKDDCFLEPAGGTGTFIEALKQKGIPTKQIISYDIEPKHPNVIKGNFLEQEIENKNLITISNPPFGRCNSLSKKFFNHSAKFSKTIAFIVPKSWRKWSVLNSLDPYFHLIKDIDLGMRCFEDDQGNLFEGDYLSTIFQVYERRPEKRKKIIIQDRGYITKVKDPKKADIALTVFGWSCGKVLEEFPRVPNTTLMFLKVKDKSVVQALKEVDLSIYYKNVSYTYALSIHEINDALNGYYDNHNNPT
jgi:hypothetical protein